MLKSLFLSLALREINKGGTHFYSAISASTTLSFFILLNLWSMLLFSEYFFGGLLTSLNNVLFSEQHYIATVIITYLVVMAIIYQRYNNLDLALLAKQYQISITKFVTYGVISSIVYICALLVGVKYT
ncbi:MULTISPECIES: hypothetical protein [Shewanella]|uniref:ABC transporter permease n=1 Tax=Shewanella marisflavi TaxID=260364 RepID=A0ABX5WIF5_9GAMM|nr:MULTISPECIES: hypothetical protein [Shewanella]QDF74190.1 hypothetical protein FGA12_02875 [Shewanella marisflavi]